MYRHLLPLAIAAALPLGACTAAARTEAPAAALYPLTIETAKAVRHLRVEIARTPEEQERGLMFRTSLPKDGGMLFPFDQVRPASFWMKNTVISLDLIFIRADGTIARIAANATPYSLDLIDSGEPVAAVLEIAGGAARAAGIAEGQKVSWSIR